MVLKISLPILLAATIFHASGQSVLRIPSIFLFEHSDKLAHLCIYGLLGTLAARIQLSRNPRTNWLYTIFIVCLYGVFDEYRQRFTMGRDVEWIDTLANTLGAIIGASLYVYSSTYRRCSEYKLICIQNRG